MCVVRAFAAFALLILVAAAENATESNEAQTDRTSGKTYFIQLKKVLSSNTEDGDNDKQYVKINHYRNSPDVEGFKEFKEVHEEEFLRKKYHDLFSVNMPENIRDATTEDVKVSFFFKENKSFVCKQTIYEYSDVIHIGLVVTKYCYYVEQCIYDLLAIR